MEELYGIDKEHGHQRALELIPDDFFWDCVDELAPFGSDEGDTALAEWRDWRKENPEKPLLDCLKWTIEGVGEMDFADYNQRLTDKNLLSEQMSDNTFDFEQYVDTLDISVIATGFGQLADEGKIEHGAKPIIQVALDRQIIVNSLGRFNPEIAERYAHYLTRLIETLDKA